MEKVMMNFAFIGAGRMANVHAKELKDMENVKIAGVYDPSSEAANKFSEEYSVAKQYSSISELAADASIDVVLVCNFTDQHYETLVELLNAGKKKIFCEKALVRHLKDGEDLVKRAQAAGAQIMVGHHRRYNNGYAKIKEMIESDRLGKIRMVKIALSHPGYTREWGDFFSDFERCGGVILDMMTHLFDVCNWYFGEPGMISGDSIMFDRSQPLPMDFVSGTLTYKSGVICNINCSWQRYGVAYDQIEVYGDKACAIFDLSDKVHLYQKGEHTEITVGKSSAYPDQMKALVDMASEGKEPLTALIDGFNSVKVGLTMIDAVKQHKTLEI